MACQNKIETPEAVTRMDLGKDDCLWSLGGAYSHFKWSHHERLKLSAGYDTAPRSQQRTVKYVHHWLTTDVSEIQRTPRSPSRSPRPHSTP